MFKVQTLGYVLEEHIWTKGQVRDTGKGKG